MADLLTFSDGLQTTTSSFLRKDSQLELAMNVNFDNIGSVTRRLGYGGYSGSLSTVSQVYGMQSYPDTSGNTLRLFAYNNGAIQYATGAAWTTVQGSLTSGAYMEARVFLDQLFVVGADTSNNYLTTANIDGTAYSTSTNVTSAPKGRLIELYLDQLYIADVVVGGVRYPSRMYSSSVPDAAGLAITWPATNYEEISTNDGESITGLHTNKKWNQLLIFKENSMNVYDTVRIRTVASVGTSCPRSVVTINGDTYFFKRGYGIYKYDGFAPVLISRPIEKWIKGIQDFSNMYTQFATKEDEKYYKLYTGNIVVDGVTYTNCEIRYSTVDNTWTIYSYADAFAVYAEHKISEVVRPYAGTTAGTVMRLAISGDAVYSDNGTEISSEFMTKALDLKQPNAKTFASRVVLYSTSPQGLTGRMRYKNQVDWSSHFSLDTPEQILNVNPGEGRFVQFHFSDNSTNSPYQFEGLSFDPLVTSEYV